MKRFIFLLVALMPVLVFAQKAKIDFTTTSHNFGTINENAGKATFDFSFKNTGNVPLILTNVRATGRLFPVLEYIFTLLLKGPVSFFGL